MKLDIKIENLGKLKKGIVKVRQLTVLAGENGTGKSFFTKTLYSIFNVINVNVLHKKLLLDLNLIDYIAREYIENIYKGGNNNDKKNIINLTNFINKVKEQILDINKNNNISLYLISLSNIEISSLDTFIKYLESIKKQPRKFNSIKNEMGLLQYGVKNIQKVIKNPRDAYVKTLDEDLTNEVLENFQISGIEELVSKNNSEFIIKSNIFKLSYKKNNLDFDLTEEFINEISCFSRVIFFESPAYWKVRDALQSAKENKRPKELSGVPKYFYDLDETLKTKSKNSSITELIKEYHNIKNEIGGEFIFDSGALYFIDNSGDMLDKNLISLGMTNLGMVGALLKHNIIDKGSFVFFDEPETNLHPKWQVLLTKILIKLADNGVNVIIATHSLDIMKSLEVYTKDKGNDFVGINYFETTGKLFTFDSDNINENLIEARNKLAEPYNDLYIENFANE
jgi:predicted ATPase